MKFDVLYTIKKSAPHEEVFIIPMQVRYIFKRVFMKCSFVSTVFSEAKVEHRRFDGLLFRSTYELLDINLDSISSDCEHCYAREHAAKIHTSYEAISLTRHTCW